MCVCVCFVLQAVEMSGKTKTGKTHTCQDCFTHQHNNHQTVVRYMCVRREMNEMIKSQGQDVGKESKN